MQPVNDAPGCLFCRIAASEVPATIVRSSDRLVAFRDVNPQAPTHVLVMPRAHHPDVDALAKADPETLAELVRAAAEIAVEEQLDAFRQRAVPEPGGVLREAPQLTNDARLEVPTTAICTGYTSDEYKAAVKEGYAWLGGCAELRNVTWVDLPTSHWPMWSRPEELARIIGDVANADAP